MTHDEAYNKLISLLDRVETEILISKNEGYDESNEELNRLEIIHKALNEARIKIKSYLVSF